MYPIELSFVEAYLQEKLSYERLTHSREVAELSVELAKIHGVDPVKARVAGLSHDICREWTEEELLDYIKRNNLDVCRDVVNMPTLAHGPVGAEFLRWKLGIDDSEILDAIASHTLGDTKMTKLQEIIFIADFVEATKGMAKSEQVLTKARESLSEATKMVYEMVFEYLKSKKMTICPKFISNMKGFKGGVSTDKQEL